MKKLGILIVIILLGIGGYWSIGKNQKQRQEQSRGLVNMEEHEQGGEIAGDFTQENEELEQAEEREEKIGEENTQDNNQDAEQGGEQERS